MPYHVTQTIVLEGGKAFHRHYSNYITLQLLLNLLQQVHSMTLSYDNASYVDNTLI